MMKSGSSSGTSPVHMFLGTCAAIIAMGVGQPLLARIPPGYDQGGKEYCCEANNNTECCGCLAVAVAGTDYIQLPNYGSPLCVNRGIQGANCVNVDGFECFVGEFVTTYKNRTGAGCASICTDPVSWTSVAYPGTVCDSESTECPL
jgi:hypothetical protein